jgi:nitrous oxide reductase accessory protein NosL
MLRSLLTCVATCLVVAGCAGTPKPAPAIGASTTARTNCVGMLTTDSRIPQSNCAPGQSYTQDDLQRTGQQDTSKALQSLDSTVQIHH